MDELIKAMSDSDLAELKVKYQDNESVTTLIDGILTSRAGEALQAKAQVDFAKGIEKAYAKLPHPDDVHNVYAYWGDVEVEDGEPEAVDITDDNGNTTTEMRAPKHTEQRWIVKVNHAIKVQAGNTNSQPTTHKRAIAVYKRNGLNLEAMGNFTSASKACEELKLTIGGDSAMRVLARDGFVVEPYTGTEFTS